MEENSPRLCLDFVQEFGLCTVPPISHIPLRIHTITRISAITEYNRVAMPSFWRIFHHDGKISPAWWGWGVHALRPPHFTISTACPPITYKVVVYAPSWEGKYTPSISTLPLSVLCGAASTLKQLIHIQNLIIVPCLDLLHVRLYVMSRGKKGNNKSRQKNKTHTKMWKWRWDGKLI